MVVQEHYFLKCNGEKKEEKCITMIIREHITLDI